jgi:CRP/FNR family transcriptional regulator, cyclic AMP receptor protein
VTQGYGLFDYPDAGLSEAPGRLQFLADRSQRDWTLILDHAEVRRFAAGEELMHAGQSERALYVLTEGSVTGVTETGVALKTIAAPSIVGEMAFLDGGPRSLTIRGLSAGEIIRLTYDAFEVIAAKDPELGRAILADLARIVTQRLRTATAHLTEGAG